MATLTGEQKAFIVSRLACHERQKDVRAAVKEEYGVEVDKRQVAQYDPSSVAGKQLGKKWKELFWETRRRFREMEMDIPIANKAYRLKRLDDLEKRALDMKNFVLVRDCLEQAAKEMGEQYTNRAKLEHTGKDGGPMQVEAPGLAALISQRTPGAHRQQDESEDDSTE